jgi:hypothetical protein
MTISYSVLVMPVIISTESPELLLSSSLPSGEAGVMTMISVCWQLTVYYHGPTIHHNESVDRETATISIHITSTEHELVAVRKRELPIVNFFGDTIPDVMHPDFTADLVGNGGLCGQFIALPGGAQAHHH